MNINGINPSYHYLSTNYHAPQKVAPDQSVTSRWNTTDTFEIRGHKVKGDVIVGGEPDEEYLWNRKQSAKFTAEDLSSLKQRFAALTTQQKDITSKLKNILNSAGIKLANTDSIKIEVNSNGKAFVGGIRDAKTAHKLEQAINSNKDFVKEIQAFQKEETAVSQGLLTVTGQSLSDFKTRISELQMGRGMDTRTGGFDFVYSAAQCIDLKDQDLYIVDNEFGTLISEHYKGFSNHIGANSVDISGDSRILENADGTVKNTINSIMGKVRNYLDDVNEGVRKKYEDDHEEMKKHLVSLANVAIKMNSEGEIAIDGHFSQYSAEVSESEDTVIKDVITNKIFKEALKDNPHTGEKNDFFIASQYLENKYDVAFDGQDPDRKLEAVFEDGQVKSRISSPKEEERLNAEITIEAKGMLEDMGIIAGNLDIAVTEEGKITVTNMPIDEQESAILTRALESLNRRVENRTNVDYNAINQKIANPADRLKGLLAKMDVFLPGGTSLLGNMEISESKIQ